MKMVLYPQSDRTYTYKDYLGWPDEERWEIIDGIPFNLTPVPSPRHQEILGELFRQISNHLVGRACRVYVAPFDVRLFPSEKQDDNTVVQPDLTVIGEPKIITNLSCEGVPDLIVEVLSPSTAKKDKGVKKRLYERAGVKEYWIVDPFNHTIEVYSCLTDGGKFGEPTLYGPEDELKVEMLEGLVMDLCAIFK